MVFFLCVTMAYLLGSIPFGKIIGRRRGIDIQKMGSGNIGFTNSLRFLGWKLALMVLLGDILKGFAPTLVALRLLPLNQALAVALVGILGHVFPVWLKFKGGKGIATSLGVTLALNPILAASAMAIFLVVVFVTKFVSLSSIFTLWSLSILAYLISPSLTLFYLALAILATWTHRENIGRLLRSREPKILQGAT